MVERIYISPRKNRHRVSAVPGLDDFALWIPNTVLGVDVLLKLILGRKLFYLVKSTVNFLASRAPDRKTPKYSIKKSGRYCSRFVTQSAAAQ